jgi:hypothetical protein
MSVELLLQNQFLLILMWLINNKPKYKIEYPISWLLLSQSNFGIGKGRGPRNQYTLYSPIDVLNQHLKYPELFRSQIYFSTEEFSHLLSLIPQLPFVTKIKSLDFNNKVSFSN